MLKVSHVTFGRGKGPVGGGPIGYVYRLESSMTEAGNVKCNVNFPIVRFGLKGRKNRSRMSSSLHYYYRRILVRTGLQTDVGLSVSDGFTLTEKDVSFDPIMWESDLIVLHYVGLIPAVLAMRRRDQMIAVITHSPTPMFAEVAANDLPQQRGLLEHCLDDRYLKRSIDRELGLYQSVDCIIAPCPEAHEAYCACGPRWAETFSKEKLQLCMTGTGQPVMQKSGKDWRDVLGVAPHQLLAVYVGRNHPHKGTEILLDAINEIDAKTREKVIFVFAGFEYSGPEIPHARFIGYTTDVGGLVRASDFVINANRYTYFDLFALEALSLGKAMLATNTGGNIVLAKMAPGVRLVPPTKAGLAEGIQALSRLESSELCELGRVNYSAWENQFSLQVFADQHLMAYERILQGIRR
jgi:glycosyltransferase involved in cell wall biosynthesis